MIKKILSIFKKKEEEKIYGFIKYERGDEVKVTIYSEVRFNSRNINHSKLTAVKILPEFWYIGKVLDINARYVVDSIEESWRVEYYVAFKPDKTGKYQLKYWFLESELRKYSLQEERNSRIDQILNYENTTDKG